jgi:hypothetical protein
MKTLLLAVAVLVLGVSIGEARQVSTRTACLSACGAATNTTCGWITRRGKYTACRTRLLRQCQRWGVGTMCPAPPPPPPTTTTTLPAPDLRGSYELNGTITRDNCNKTYGVGSRDQMPFTVTAHNGTALEGTVGTNPRPATGTLFADQTWVLAAKSCEANCCFVASVAVDALDPQGASAHGQIEVLCTDATACTVELEGFVAVYS